MRLDDSLQTIFATLPNLRLGRIVRPSVASRYAAKRAFLNHGTLPVFEYPKTANVDFFKIRQTLTVARQSLAADNSPAPLKQLYEYKLNEYATRLDLVEAITQSDDARVTALSYKLYGQPNFSSEDFELEFEKRCLDLKHERVHHHAKRIDAKTFATQVHEALERLRIENVEIRLSTRTRVLCQRNPHSGKLFIRIPKKLSISRNRAKRLIAHEIEIHALRRQNGAQSQLHILEHGTAGYVKTEEGLALYHQAKRVPSSHHLPGFWDSWTIALMQRLGFAQAYQRVFDAKKTLLDLAHTKNAAHLAQEKAWDLCVRACRGITHPGKPGLVYAKDSIYRAGYLAVHKAMMQTDADKLFKTLHQGKIGLEDIQRIASLNLNPQLSLHQSITSAYASKE